MKKFIFVFAAVLLLSCSVSKAQVSFSKHQFIGLGHNLSTVMVDYGDMDGDGAQEVVAMYVSGDTMQLAIYKIDDNPALTTSETFIIKTGINSNSEARNFITLNANSDNRLDVIYAHGDSVTILYQKPNGSFGLDSSLRMYSGLTVDGIAKGDFDHNGMEDFVTTNWSDTHITIYSQTGVGSGFGKTYLTSIQAGYNQIKVADVNGDGWDELCFLAGQGMNAGVYIYQNVAGYFTASPMYIHLDDMSGNTTITNSFSAGNFMGTGTELFLSPQLSTLSCNIFTAAGILDQTITLPPFGKSSYAADFNGDNKDELVALTNSSSEMLMVVEYTPSLVVNAFPSQITGNYHSLDQAIACADVVGNDSKIDIVTISDDFNGGITIWKNDLILTGVRETTSSLEIGMYPNPTTDYINIAVDLTSEYEVTIMDVSGRVIRSQIYDGAIDVRTFSPGVYLVLIKYQGKTATKKIIIQ